MNRKQAMTKEEFDSITEPEAPRATLVPGDRVLLCPECNSYSLGHGYLSDADATAFWCLDCKAEFLLTIERRQDQVCLLWQWVPKGGAS
jgi:hypothetical protein